MHIRRLYSLFKQWIWLFKEPHIAIFTSLKLSLKYLKQDSALKIKVFKFVRYYTFKTANITVKNGPFRIGACWPMTAPIPSSLKLDNNSSIQISDDFSIYTGFYITVNPHAKLTLGSGYINTHATIHCWESITIGKNVAIGEHVIIRDSDNHTLHRKEYKMTAPIIIEDNVWIGSRVSILKGVTIGKGSVIAAGSVVTKDIPANTAVAGVPAKTLYSNITWS